MQHLSPTPAGVAGLWRKESGFAWIDSSLEDSPGLSLLAHHPDLILEGSATEWHLLESEIERRKRPSPDLGIPEGAAIGYFRFDGSFRFGFFDEPLLHDGEHWTSPPPALATLFPAGDPSPLLAFLPEMKPAEYVGMVRRAQDYVRAGDIYQVCLAHRFSTAFAGDPWPLYLALREASPAPHSVYLALGDETVLSSSPECFLKMSGRRISTRPIKGTRPRMRDPEEDERQAFELKTSPKEIAELTLEEATAHFQEHHAENEVELAEGELKLSGRAALHESTQLLRELLLTHLREMDRFPLPLAQAVGRELTNRGLQLFKSHRKIIHVSMVRPKYLDRTTTPVAQGFISILEYLEAHPNQSRDKQWNALLSGRTEIPEEGEAAPQEKILECREKALGVDLLWLLHQGHVIDFAMGNLQAATRPAPKQPAKKKVAETLPSTSTNETLIGDTDEVQPGGSSAMPSEHPEDIIMAPTEDHEPLEIPADTALETPPPVDPGEFLPKE